MKIRTLIVDDEPLGRKRIHKLLMAQSDFEVVGESRDGREALNAIRNLAPQLVFLDVQMPEMNGFEVLGHLDPATAPIIVFVTAHDDFAVKAFQAQALDYLLKPFDDERFTQALKRARSYLAGHDAALIKQRLASLMDSIQPQSKYLSRVAVKAGKRIVFLKIESIDWIEAVGNYVKFHTGAEAHLLRGRLSELEKKLNPDQFFRVHRSTLVNLDRVREFQPLFKGEGIVLLKDGQRLAASRTCSQRLQQTLQPEL
jgi:two-component system LytT family response regulator